MGSVPDSVELEELAALVESFGVIDSMRLVRPKSCAFINFADETVARALQVSPLATQYHIRVASFLIVAHSYFSLFAWFALFPVLTCLKCCIILARLVACRRSSQRTRKPLLRSTGRN